MNASGRLLARLTVLGVLGTFGMTAALPVHADNASPESSQTSAATELAALHEAPWDRRGDFILSLKASLEVLSELPEDAPAAHSWAEGGSRTGWVGEAWTDGRAEEGRGGKEGKVFCPVMPPLPYRQAPR